MTQSPPPLVNQNEISEGRLKRSQTRIASGSESRQAGVRRASSGQGTSEVEQSSWAMFASPSSWPAASGTANSGSGQRSGRCSSPRIPSPPSPILLMTATTMTARKIRPTRIVYLEVTQSIESGPVTSALRNCATKAFSESKSSSLGPDSTILPFHSTARKSAIRRAVLRSWLIVR